MPNLPTAFSKDDLRAIAANKGKLVSDTGQILDGVVAARRPRAEDDGLYHGELKWRGPADDEMPETVSLAEIFGKSPLQDAFEPQEPEELAGTDGGPDEESPTTENREGLLDDSD